MIVIVGSGISGTAAALAARAKGADVTLVLGAAGATMLAPGTIDVEPWDGAPAPTALDAGVQSIVDALAIHSLKPEPAWVATITGLVRSARGIDRALLDLARLPRGVIFLPEIDREGWDAPLLARALAESRFAKEHGLAFQSGPSQLLVATSERTLPDGDMAARSDDPARLSQLAERIQASISGKHVAAVLLPPWLGVDGPRAEALSKEVGVPCGEIAAALSSPAGLRFVRARDRALAKAGVVTQTGWATSIEHDGDVCILHLGSAENEAEPIRAKAIVLATGGIVAGGVTYTPSEAALATALPRTPRAVFASSIKNAGALSAFGQPIGIPGSLFGTSPESLAWPFRDPPALDRVGLLANGESGILAAGDAVADEPRTFLGALRSGVRAGQSAAALSARV